MKKLLSLLLALCLVFGFVYSPYAAKVSALDLDIDSSEEADTSLPVTYVNADGSEYEWANNNAHNAYYYYDAEKQQNIATVEFDSTVYSIVGWYHNGEFVSENINYTFDLATTDVSKLSVKLASRNILVGGAGFEGYENGENLRVSPPETGVAPHDDKWGIYCIYAKSSSTKAGYEQPDWGFTINAVKGAYTDDYIDSYYYDETGATVRNYKEHTIYPYDGNAMLKLSMPSRSAVRKIEGLKPNTSYTFKFYAYTPDQWDYIKTVTVANTYEIETYATTAKSPKVVYGYYSEPVINCDQITSGLENTDRIRKWTPYSVSFKTGDATEDDGTVDAYVHISITSKNNKGSNCEFMLDNITCTEDFFANAGNSIRASSTELPQALRYKFFMSNTNLASYNGMPSKKVGILVAATNWLGEKELVVGGEYNYGGKVVKPQDKTVTENNKQYVEGDSNNTYFTAALYNVGCKLTVDSQTGEAVVVSTDYAKYGSNYSVRPYIVYSNTTENKDVIMYGETINVSVFDVMYQIRNYWKNKDDLAVVNNILLKNENKEVYNQYKNWQNVKETIWHFEDRTAADYEQYTHSFALVPDTQYINHDWSDYLSYTYDWIIDHKDSNKINYVIGLGDITDQSTNATWLNAKEQFMRIKEAGIYHSIVRGNHDRIAGFDNYITTEDFGYGYRNADGKVEIGTQTADKNIGSANYGTYDATMKNAYNKVEISGIKYLMLAMDLFPSVAEVAWAAKVVENNPDYNVFINTHAYWNSDITLLQEKDVYDVYDRLDAQGNKIGGKSPQYIFDEIVNKYSNVVFVACGHEFADGPTYKVAEREDGSKAVQMIVDPQHWEYEKIPYGMIAMLYFKDGGKTVDIEYFSAIRDGEFYSEKYQIKDLKLDLVDAD